MSLTEDVAGVLRGSCWNIDFEFDKWRVSSFGLGQVGWAILQGRITVLPGTLPKGTVFAYSTVDNCFYYPQGTTPSLKDTWTQSSFVHEGTHALNDMWKRSGISKIDNEASAYIAQWLFLIAAGRISALPAYYSTMSQFKAVSDAASAVAKKIHEGTFDVSGEQALKDLRAALEGHPDLYQSVKGQLSDDNRGVAVRGIVKTYDTARSKLTISTGKRDAIYKITAATQIVNSNWDPIALGLKDPLFKIGAKVLVTAEDATDADLATWIEPAPN